VRFVTGENAVFDHSAANTKGEGPNMSASRHLLIVDGNAATRTELAREIGRLGYVVSSAPTAEAAFLALGRADNPDMVLVDSALPDATGRELVARMRRRGVMQPVILIADSASEDEVVAGLDSGADDFMVRPLRLRELGARIRAQLRVSMNRDEADMRIGMLTFRPATRTAFQPFLAQPVQLTEKEAALLGRLCRAEGRPVARDTLLREVWGYSPNAASHTVETHIYRLRRKIEGNPASPQLIVNDQGGYRLAAHEAADVMVAVPAPAVAAAEHVQHGQIASGQIKWAPGRAAKAALVPTMRMVAGGLG
jgi:DNA-binding response OmpR family regulator